MAKKPEQEQAFDDELQVHARQSIFGVQERLLNHPRIKAAVAKARQAGITWPQIIAVILPFILDIISGKPIDIAAIVAAILVLIGR